MSLGLENVPLHFGWDIVEWNPKLSQKPVDLGENLVKILEICDEIEKKEPEVFGPQIELNLENPSDLGEPPVEVAREAPTVVEIVDEPSEEGKAVEEIRTGAKPCLLYTSPSPRD